MGVLIDHLARAGSLLKHSLTAACEDMAVAIGNLRAQLTPVRMVPDLPYGSAPDQLLDVYALPQVRSRPIVVFWYGGGWTSGAKSDYRFMGTALAESGYVAVVPDYRKYPAVQFPSFVEDGARALNPVATVLGGCPTEPRPWPVSRGPVPPRSCESCHTRPG